MKVFVYRNLHKGCWSVRCAKTRRVIAHADRLFLEAPVFKVSAAGRARVLRERRKNVHAGVEGWWNGNTGREAAEAHRAKALYNPYKYETFVHSETGRPILRARWAQLGFDGVYISD